MIKRGTIAMAFGAALVVLLTLLRAADPFPLRMARETTFDFFQQLKPRADPGLPITIVDIDEGSLARIGQWPWPRDVMATLADRLTQMGAAAIAFDVLFAEADRTSADPGDQDHDAAFARALSQGPTIVSLGENAASPNMPEQAKASFAISGSDVLSAPPELTGATLPLPQFLAAATGVGVVSLARGEGGGVVRRLPLLWSNGSTLFPALSLEALRVAQGLSTLVVLGDTEGRGSVDALKVGQFEVPTGPTGDMWLYYRRLDASTYVPAGRLMDANYADLEPRIAGHIVLIGASATGLLDVRASALGENIPGVSIHLQAIEQMMSGTLLSRADWVGGLEIALFAAAGLAIVAVIVFSGPLAGLLMSLAIAALSAAASWIAFANFGLLLDPSFTLLGALLVYAAMAFFQFAVTDADKRRIRSAFAHYVAPALLSQIENSAGELRLGGEVRQLTVMFSDVRNYTAISERLPPARLVRLLNTVFGALGGQITAQFGTIDKFMGDAIMAFWNAPIDVPGHPQRACQAALGMRAALRALNEGHSEGLEGEPVAIGIGVATGPALVGNMGLETRFDYSCVGETVNIASRIEGACRAVGYDIVVTDETRQAAPEMAMLEAGALVLKGIAAREPIFLLVGDKAVADSAAFQALFDHHGQLTSALRANADITAVLAKCVDLAQTVEPGLLSFYAAISGRTADFADRGLTAQPAQ